MPTKTRPKRKLLPAILRTPIEISLDLLPKAFGKSTPQAEAEEKRICEERSKRLKEVFKLYDVDPSNPDDLVRFIYLMSAQLFPDGFKCVLEGEHKTRKTKWTATRKCDLVIFMRACRDTSQHTEIEAAKLYAKVIAADFGHLAPEGLVARYHEAQKWVAARELTAIERLDLLQNKPNAISWFE